MFQTIALVIFLLILGFIIYVGVRNGKFRYERSGVINASPEKVYSILSNLRMGEHWSPYEKMDPEMKKTFSGEDGKEGSRMDFEDSKGKMTGRLEVIRLSPYKDVDLRLNMFKPFEAENIVEYRLTPEDGGTRFTWAMSGEAGFMGKIFMIVFNGEKMNGDQFTQGINNLKEYIEGKK